MLSPFVVFRYKLQGGGCDMLETMRQTPMAKKQGRPKKPGGEGTQVRIDSQVARKAKFVASEKGVSLADYLTGLLRPQVDKEYLRCVKAIGDDTQS